MSAAVADPRLVREGPAQKVILQRLSPQGGVLEWSYTGFFFLLRDLLVTYEEEGEKLGGPL